MKRRSLLRAVKALTLLAAIAIAYVVIDFAIDIRPASVHSSYQFRLRELAVDQPVYLQQDNLSVVVIRRSPALILQLQQQQSGLQDPQSSASRQPDYARNLLRSRHAELFVSYGLGTDLGCQLETSHKQLQEICGKARYDFAGRALQADTEYSNLAIPNHEFSSDFKLLTITP